MHFKGQNKANNSPSTPIFMMHCPCLHFHSFSVIHVFLLKQKHFEVQIVVLGVQGGNFCNTKHVVIAKQVLSVTSACS